MALPHGSSLGSALCEVTTTLAGRGCTATRSRKRGIRQEHPLLLLNLKLELHLSLIRVMGVVKGHVVCKDLAHDDDFCVLGYVEQLGCHQRVAVVGLKGCSEVRCSEIPT
jgi:hypothetical protein